MTKGSMSLRDCEAYAKKHGFDSLKFIAMFPAGAKVCRWLDAYLGLFQIEGMEGFVTVNSICETFPDVACFPAHVEEA